MVDYNNERQLDLRNQFSKERVKDNAHFCSGKLIPISDHIGRYLSELFCVENYDQKENSYQNLSNVKLISKNTSWRKEWAHMGDTLPSINLGT